MKKTAILLTLSLMILGGTYSVFAAGHDANCVECHSIHEAKGAKLIAVVPDTKTVNQTTGKPLSGISALCQGCHKGEGGPEIAIMKTHPIGVIPNPKRAQVPPEWLRDGGLFECSSCHDFHPSNPFYKYLRTDVGTGGSNLGKFCAVCHADKRGKVTEAAPAPKK